MGIHGLMNLVADEAPESCKEQDIKALVGRKVAIDASMALYQFLIAVRSAEHAGAVTQMLTNEAGEVTSHIQGLFNRTIRMLTNGVKPCYVFDGKPPTLKSGELAKRTKARTKAKEELKAAEEREDAEDIDKYSKRLVKVTREHNEDAKRLLRLMGVPVIEAPGEAEAQCAALAKAGLVWATATEDMDALTFQTPHLLKRMTFSAKQQAPIMQISHDKLLHGLGITQEQFVDLCILCGCDYCDRPSGIGPKTALKLVRKYGNLENIVKNLDKKKHPLPVGWERPAPKPADPAPAAEPAASAPEAANDADQASEGGSEVTHEENETDAQEPDAKPEPAASAETAQEPEKEQPWEPLFVEVRQLFHTPLVQDPVNCSLKWTEPDEEGLIKFLVEEKGFNAERVSSGIKKLKEMKGKGTQQRMDSFFKSTGMVSSSKRKAAPAKAKPSKKGKISKGKK